ncbi:lysophospholipid acyltransferase family protein [bacterium SCSIO 12741]|nr:lysophospholipid acyltransferase family protein [bacterium SCSIO 12741]
MSYFLTACLYYLVLFPISSLPMKVLYGFSNFLFFLMYRVVGYRRKVVQMNLRNSFPEKSDQELQDIEKKFYEQFCDNLIESVKGLTLSPEFIKKRMVCRNPELLDRYFEQGKSVIITTGHYYSWEWWFLAIDMPVKHKIVLIYKQLSNAYLEGKLKSVRSSFGLLPLAFQDVRGFFAEKENGSFGYIFGSDQAPHKANKAYWVHFLNQETPVAFGAEKFAVEKDIPVVFCRINRLKRGHFEFEYLDVCSDPKETNHGDITKKFTLLLEQTIQRDPVGWLWTHKRWKREKPEGMDVHSL